MEEIKIYYSVRENGKSAFFWFCLAAFGLSLILLSKKPVPVTVYFATALFASGTLFYISIILKEQIRHKPYLRITEEGLQLNWGKGLDVRFSDVERFVLYQTQFNYKRRKWKELIGWKDDVTISQIGIEYKKEVGERKLSESGCIERTFRKINYKQTGIQDSILTIGLTASPEEICNILNDRLTRHKALNQST